MTVQVEKDRVILAVDYGCNGNESISKTKCSTRRGSVQKLIVKVKNGTPNSEYTATLDTGQQVTKNANSNGKISFKFKGNNKPPCGDNGVTLCDLHKAFRCGC